MSKTYTVTLTAEQMQSLSRAAEIVSRLGIGQFRDALECLPIDNFLPEGWHEDMAAIGMILSKHMIGRVDGWRSNLGIHNERVSDDSRVLWDLYQVMRHRLAWDRAVESGMVETLDSPRKWPEMMQVCFDEPSRIGNQPLAVVSPAAEG